jgi:predicted transcriptional regulator
MFGIALGVACWVMPDAPAQTSSAILSKVARLFGKYNLVAAPLVDMANRLVGVITIDDVVDVIEKRQARPQSARWVWNRRILRARYR